MPSDPKIADFVEKALAAGIPHDSLVGILTAEGWPEKEIYQALADHYRRVTGIDIPRRAGAATSAKDAFFYLLVFGTLSVWTFAVGAICFELIDYWLRDPLFTSYTQSLDTSVIASCIAAIFVTFPIFLLLSRAVAREIAAQPEKLDSGIRKWLTYMALVIAAATFMGDLIGIIAYLLRGEFTSRFLAKSFVVLVLSGGVFFYYFGGLRKAEPAARSSRDRLMAALSSAVAIIALVLGFTHLGTPRVQRDLRADEQRVNHLYQLASNITMYWNNHKSQLPQSLDQLPGVRLADPITQARYEYRPAQGSHYELCAKFDRQSQPRAQGDISDAWAHPVGHHCFELDATAQTPYAPPPSYGD